MTYREFARRLRQLGCEEMIVRRRGSHRRWFNPANNGEASVPDWGSRDLKIGTLRAIARDLGLNWDDVNRGRG